MPPAKKPKSAGAKKASSEPTKTYRSITEIRRDFYPNANLGRKQPSGSRADRMQNGLLGTSTRAETSL